MQVAFTITYNGKKQKITVEDDIPFGKVQDLISNLSEGMMDERNKGKMVSTMIDLSQKLMERVVVTAPWDLTKGWPARIGVKTNKTLIEEISKIYPLDELFTGLITTMIPDSEQTK